MRSIASDIMFAIRSLRRRPGFAAMAITTLALGIGATSAIFTIIDGVLLRPLPFRGAGELVTVWQTDTRFRDQTTLRRRWDRLWFTFPEYQQWRAEQRSFSEVALYGSQEMALTELGEPAEIAVFTATPTLLPLLGVQVLIGRWFLPGEEGTGTARIAVISHELWVSRFGSDSSVINRQVTLDGQRFRIVGVMPDGFELRSLTAEADVTPAVWIPLGSDGGGQEFDSSYEGIGRLRAGVSIAAAALETDRIVRSAVGRTERGARLLPRLEAETSSARAPLLLLGAGVALLLLIACANITMLLLGEAPAREHELATRTALGATRGRLARQLVTESVVLAFAGGAAGLALAWAGTRTLLALAPAGLPRLDQLGVNLRVLVFSAAVTLGAALAFGLAPAVTVSRRQIGHTLRSTSRQAGRGPRRLLDAVIIAQIAMALVLLAGAGVLARSLHGLWTVDPGFRASGVLTTSVTLPESRYPDNDAVRAFYDRLEERLAALPGVRSVGATSNLPFSGRNATTSVEIDGVPAASAAERPSVQRRVVRPGYFATLGVPLRAGRTFGDGGRATPADAIVVDEVMARRSWPTESAVGKRVRVFGAWRTVIGVVGSVHHGRLDETPQPTVYLPQASIATREMMVVLRIDGNPLALADLVRRSTWSMDATIPVPSIEAMSSRVSRSIASERYRTTLLSAFGIAAALLTAVGIFGVIVRAVSQRRREIAIRLALGAKPPAIARSVMRDQGRSIVAGLALGLLGARAVSPLLGRFVFGVGPSDPLALAGAAGLLLLMAAAGAYGPVRAALRTDPGIALRGER